MKLNLSCWTNNEIEKYHNFIYSLKGNIDNIERTKIIVNTKMECLGIKIPKLNEIAKEIMKGNYYEFLNNWTWKYYEETIVIGKILSKFKDFNELQTFLMQYSQMADNWSTIDTLKFNFTTDNKQQFFDFAQDLIKSKFVFSRRLGLIILLKMSNFSEYSDKILNVCGSLMNETEYYVNMANAWLVAEMFVKYRDKTLQFYQKNKLNKFTKNKSISKCCDSFRVKKVDKQLLNHMRIV